MLHHHTRRLLVALGATAVLAVPLSGCGAVAEKAVEEATGGKVDIKDGGKDITIEGPDGQKIEVGSGAELPSDWPTDVPIPAGAKVVSAASVNESASGGGKNVTLETAAEPAALLESFKSSLESNGWTIQTETNSTDGGSIAAEQEGTPKRNVVVFVSGGEGGKTTANVTVANSSN